MDSLDGLLELLKFEIDHDDIILLWATVDVEQNLTIEYFDVAGDSTKKGFKIN